MYQNISQTQNILKGYISKAAITTGEAELNASILGTDSKYKKCGFDHIPNDNKTPEENRP